MGVTDNLANFPGAELRQSLKWMGLTFNFSQRKLDLNISFNLLACGWLKRWCHRSHVLLVRWSDGETIRHNGASFHDPNQVETNSHVYALSWSLVPFEGPAHHNWEEKI